MAVGCIETAIVFSLGAIFLGAVGWAILTVDSNSPEFPDAWAAFVRLRQVDRDISQAKALERGRLMLRNAPKNNGVNIGMSADEVRNHPGGSRSQLT